MHEIHALIDAELFTIGEKFYLPTLREQWKVPFRTKCLMESSNEYQKVNYYNSLFIIKSKVCMFFGGLYKSLQEKNAFFKSGRYIAYINTKLLRERGS